MTGRTCRNLRGLTTNGDGLGGGLVVGVEVGAAVLAEEGVLRAGAIR